MEVFKDINTMIKKCPVCNENLIPYGNTFLHADVESTCDVSGWIRINIEVSKSYEDKIGTPTTSFDDIVNRLAYLELNWFKRLLFRLKGESMHKPEKQ